MVDQNEIDHKARSWLRDQSRGDVDSPSDARRQWDRFVMEHDTETARALRTSVEVEVFLLLDALIAGIAEERGAGVSIDDSVMADIRRAGSTSFAGGRDEVRRYLHAIVDNREELLRRLLHE